MFHLSAFKIEKLTPITASRSKVLVKKTRLDRSTYMR